MNSPHFLLSMIVLINRGYAALTAILREWGCMTVGR